MNSDIKKKNNVILDSMIILVGIISMAYHIGLKIAFGHIAFSIVFFILGLILVIYGLIEISFKINLWRKLPKILRNIITILFAIGLSVFIVIEGIIIYEGHHKDTGKTDYLMVLGAGLRGKELSVSLKYRLDAVIEFNKLNPDMKIIVSGGQGQGEDVTEAFAMRKYLIDKGVNEHLIICEDKSTSTYENFLFTKELLEKEIGNEDYIITVVTNNFHMYRAKYLGEKIGFKCLGYPAQTHMSTSLNYHVREFFGVIKAYIFNK
ncbi:YdcF family protein [Clostridium gasigenes]|uniref:YdcF family protein n=1 Tax=Clostridium gasigenes TaxID=94869 RepID=UPI001C0D9DB7|nr:YdcF family protein [Clostridium gasigenes]MBU3103642.1 YdcF family protein [Clostridium gasigenes]MBU3133014.1 YdcF family protein [Clostridium gasigenes]